MESDSSGANSSRADFSGADSPKYKKLRENNFQKNCLLKQLNMEGGLHIFTFPSGQGNFILIRHKASIMIIDGGSQDLNKNNLFDSQDPIFNKIKKGVNKWSIFITHPHADHFNWIKYILNNLFESKNEKVESKNEKVENISFFFGGEGNDYVYCKKYAPDNIISHFYTRRISDSIDSNNPEVKDNWIKWNLTKSNDSHYSEEFFNFEIEKKIKSIIDADVHILSPLPYNPSEDDKSSQSLILIINFGVGTVLFTGDPTGKTLDKIYGNTKSIISNEREVSKYNKGLLKRVNFLIAPHHGSEKEGSPFWLSSIIKLSSFSFTGTIFCAPQISTFNHPNRYIDTIYFPPSAKLWYHKIGYYEDTNKREKKTSSSIFITSYSKCEVFWLKLTKSGMFMYSDESMKLIQILSENGWSMYTQKLLDLCINEKYEPFLYLILRNPKELSVLNYKGETPFLQILRSNLNNKKSIIKIMFLMVIILSNDNEKYHFENFIEGHDLDLLDNYKEYKKDDISFKKGIKYLFHEDELKKEDIEKLNSLNDPLISKIVFYLEQKN